MKAAKRLKCLICGALAPGHKPTCLEYDAAFHEPNPAVVRARDKAFDRVLRVLDSYRPHGHGVEVDAETAKVKFIRAELAAMRAWLVHVPEGL